MFSEFLFCFLVTGKFCNNSMKNLRTIVDGFGISFIERFGYFLNPLVLKIKKENKQLLVFYFHGLFESYKQKDLNHIDPQTNMTVEQFADFIDYFQNHNYTFLLPEDLKSDLEDGPYAMITFDDGYFNNTLAVQMLNKYKVPAVIFISTKNITENKSYWWDIIYKYRTKQGTNIEKIRDEQNFLKKLKYPLIDDYILKNFGKKAFTPWSDIDRPFKSEEITELVKNPNISIGNHTHNHAILINYSKEEIKEELSVSNKVISDLTGSMPVSIAFPNGNYNQQVLEVTEEEGFQYAFSIEPRRNLFPMGDNKLTCLNRYMTNTTNINKFGGFCRMGYTPNTLYDKLILNASFLKKKLKIFS